MDLTTTAKNLTQYLGENEEDWQMATSARQINRLVRGASELTTCHLTETQVGDLFYAFGEVSDATRAAEWTGRPPWDDQFELLIQKTVHTYTAELNRVLTDHGFTGEVVADTLDDILEPKQLTA